MSFINISPSRPNIHTLPEAWNASWEKDLAIWETYRDKPPHLFLKDPKMQILHSAMEPQILLIINQYRREIIQLQADTRKSAVTALATRNFHEEWRSLESSVRKKYILEALCKTSDTGPDMDPRRKWCPETTLESLGKDGQTYLDLLTVLIESDTGSGEAVGVTFFPHPIVDKIFDKLATLQGELQAVKLRINRTYYITLLIWNIYLRFYDISEVSRFQYMEKPGPTMKKTARTARKEAFPSAKERDAYRRKESEFRERSKSEGLETRYCWGCGKSQALLALLHKDTALRACAGCLKINRTIYYCSKECQVSDWKNGNSQPHKIICGKPFEDSSSSLKLSAVQKLNDPVKIIPPADGSFKRSSALRYQISLLERDSKPDYYLVPKQPFDDIGVSLGSDKSRIVFIAWRQRALRNRDPTAVQSMFLSLKSIASTLAPSLSYNLTDLKRQLEEEYCVAITVGETEARSITVPKPEELQNAANILGMHIT